MYYKELKLGKNFNSTKYHFPIIDVDMNATFSSISSYVDKGYFIFNKKVKLYVARYISSITKTVYNDSVKYFITATSLALSKNSDKFFVQDKLTYTVKVSADNQLKIFTNKEPFCSKRTFYTLQKILSHLKSMPENEIKSLLEEINIPQQTHEYYFNLNTKLKELPFYKDSFSVFYYEGTSNKHRNRILYYLQKGDTKKATDAALKGNYPKSIKRIFNQSTTDKRIWTLVSRGYLAKLYETYSVDRVVNILKLPNVSSAVYSHYTLDSLFSIEYLSKMLMNREKRGYVYDSAAMYSLLKQRYDISIKPSPKEKIERYHNRLVIEYNKINTSLDFQNEKLRKPHKSSILPYFNSVYGLLVRPSINALELKDIGNKLSICVGCYDVEQMRGDLEICLVTDRHNNYLACLEIKNNTLVQAKLKHNKYVYTNSIIQSVIETWCSNNNIEINTTDMYKPEHLKHLKQTRLNNNLTFS